jgi:ATP-binding cassette subfamily B (MDR/TAP) protein 1
VGFTRLAAINAPEWPFLVIGTLASAALGMQMPAFALAVSNIIAVFFNPDRDYVRSEVSKWCWVFAGAGFGSLVMGVLQQYSFTYMGQKLTRRLRGMLLGAILHQVDPPCEPFSNVKTN